VTFETNTGVLSSKLIYIDLKTKYTFA